MNIYIKNRPMKQTNINLNQLHSIISTIVEEKMDTKTELKNAYDQLKRAKTALRGKGKKHGELKELTKALRKAADEIMELDDAATDEVRENEESEVVDRNEKSKGHGKYFGIEENKKTKVVKLKESGLRNVIRRVIAEDDKRWMQGVDKEIEKDGTGGTFRKYCLDNGFKDGCSKECIDKARRSNDKKLHYRAGLAAIYCKSNR